MKYVKRPIVIEAWEVGKDGIPSDVPLRQLSSGICQVYDRLHNTWVNYENGNFIIEGVAGEHYPCVADVFHKTYELVGE